ncbi:MAG: filamentous hemagglutinin N-terminal domain-containing protein [Gammaproteobacteria bacterium]|nr:filamentous hemagglutinin N-terminal domain-containing protein [Gammaproteobacteria bacterium]MCF6261460.1 filamentous hemagglutinin N-terminal domain-containing protein [Gammaproteobacteria bacterium]
MIKNEAEKLSGITNTANRVLRNTCHLGFYSVLLGQAILASIAYAGPTGGEVVGGSGSISQSGINTTINQTTQNMAINWQSYNINANERVQYIQPDSSSISLNRILSQNGSTIAGRIDANGQVILVNPNGIFFTPTSIINVGGIIASGLNIQPNDFMNGNYIFDEVLGTTGTVINSGMINASLGGNVALIGKQVKNDGLIVANLGSVSLSAGKQAVLTFDDNGLLGVRVSKEILQEELGIDSAVINSGEINAEGGRVLLTASTSQNVFSQAVNSGELDQPLSVVMHEDGSFTLGHGADVLNTGSIDTSTNNNNQALYQNTGRIVLLGENVTSSGELLANAANGNGGEIELHAQNTTLLTENSVTSVRSEANG